MATPSEVRADLAVVTAAAISDTQAVARAAESPSEFRAALFAAVPLIVSDYMDGAAALALDWYEELREAARPRRAFTPRPLTVVRDDKVVDAVAWATRSVYDAEQRAAAISDEIFAEVRAESLALLEPVIQKDVASGFRDTMTGNVADDPDAIGWRRYARAGACKFCLMLADKGAVYTDVTADFAAHTTCHCLAGPSFDPDAPKASAIQYVASAKRARDPKVRAERNARVREYLNTHFPDARG